VARFKITVSTIDGNILEFPKELWVDCSLVTPVGEQVVKFYNKEECVVSKKVYMVVYQGHKYGLDNFTDLQQFLDYLNSQCRTEKCCDIAVNGCIVTYQGKNIKYVPK
jgi:hypothetical protein